MAQKAKGLGVTLDSDMTTSAQLTMMCRSLHLQLRKIGSIRHYLTVEASKTLVTSLILSRIDYCNSILAGLPANRLQKLQAIQNCAARMVCRKPKSSHVTPLLITLHWLPIQQRIDYKVAVTCFKCLNNSAPGYLCDLLEKHQPGRSLRSAKDTTKLKMPPVNLQQYGGRAFLHYGPKIWNRIPPMIRESETLDLFKGRLKTHLFRSLDP